MRNLIKNTILVLVMLFLGLFLVSCEKDNPHPEPPVVTEPTEPTEPKTLQTAFRLKVYYTKLNLKDTTYIEIVGLGNEKEVETKVVPEGDISVSNYREGKYDLVDSTDYYGYNTVFRYDSRYRVFDTDRRDLFHNLYREGYIHKVVVEISNIDAIDYIPSRLSDVTKSVFITEFEKHTYYRFKYNFLDAIYTQHSNGKSIYYIKDLITNPVNKEVYIEFKDVPYYK